MLCPDGCGLDVPENHAMPVRAYWIGGYADEQFFHVFGGNNDGIVARFYRRDEAEKFVRAVNSHKALRERDICKLIAVDEMSKNRNITREQAIEKIDAEMSAHLSKAALVALFLKGRP